VLHAIMNPSPNSQMKAKSVLRSIAKIVTKFSPFAILAKFAYRPEIAKPLYVAHDQWEEYLALNFNKPGMRILEVGSRNVTGANLRGLFKDAQYTGFDIYPGENVDIVGDAHKLSTYFEPDRFDLIFSSAVFEHLAMPWIVAEEIQKLLKIGGQVFIETHFSFSSHERPWNFFQFSDMGLKALFNPALGFETIDSGMSNPIIGFFAPQSDKYLRHLPVIELYCHSEILCRKIDTPASLDWRDIDIDTITGRTSYPTPKA